MGGWIGRRRAWSEETELSCQSGNSAAQDEFFPLLPDDFPIFELNFLIEIAIIAMISAHNSLLS
jgi:hypothetical protein